MLKVEQSTFEYIETHAIIHKPEIGDGVVKAILEQARVQGRVMLVVPSQRTVYGVKIAPAYPAIGILSIASILEKAGHSVTVIDQDADDIDNDSIMEEYIKEKYNILGITSVTPTYPAAVSLAKACKAMLSDVVIILGGIHATIDYINCLKDNVFDFIVVGEGECTVIELVDAIMDVRITDYSFINGLAFKLKNQEIVITNSRKLIKDLDEYPSPAYHLIRNLSKYKPADSNTK